MPTEMKVSAEHCLRQTAVDGGYIVSTIRLKDELRTIDGLIGMLNSVIGDIGRADLSAPGSYETMVFPGTAEDGIQDWSELDFRRYTTEAEALAGHDELVERWNAMPAGMGRDDEVEEWEL